MSRRLMDFLAPHVIVAELCTIRESQHIPSKIQTI